MCGIAGGTGVDAPDRRESLERQLLTLRHRGPDSHGFLPGARGSVGQSRLAIIDVAGGDPPLTDESRGIRVALNGEIYNFQALMDRLTVQGHRFASRCDTEVLAHLAEELPPVELARRLDGMFAFAIWYEQQERLVLGRDRLGKKPLYYWTDGVELVFGSEIKAVLADPRVPRRLRAEAIPEYLSAGYAWSPNSFYEGIVSLPPGCVLTFQAGSGLEVEPYWELTAPSATDLFDASFDELSRTLRDLLRTAVSKRLVADVPLGAFLSGGVDSSAVVGLMAEHMDTPVQTFSIGFDETAYDERRWARLVSQRFGTKHVEEVVRPDASAFVDELLDACDEPMADPAALPTLLLSGVTRRHVTVALTGDGGDELFAGYERFLAGLVLGRASHAPAGLRRLAGSSAGVTRLPTKVRRALAAAGDGMPGGYERLVSVFSPEQLDRLQAGASRTVEQRQQAVWALSAGAPMLSRLLDLNIRTYLLDDLLVKTDRMSMRHGLEVRSPLLDVGLLEFALRVPARHHVRGTSLKRLLKASVQDLVPAEILKRPKKGFGVPVDAWFRGPLRAQLHDLLLADSARLRAHVSHDAVRVLLAEHDSGRHDHGNQLWSLLLLERFLRRET